MVPVQRSTSKTLSYYNHGILEDEVGLCPQCTINIITQWRREGILVRFSFSAGSTRILSRLRLKPIQSNLKIRTFALHLHYPGTMVVKL